MGNSSSSSNKPLTQEQRDIQYLGDRMPFGDAELRRLYRCYYAIDQLPRNDRNSFLSDWGVKTYTTFRPRASSTRGMMDASSSNMDGGGNDWTNAQAEEREVLLQVLETKILPPGFGNRLYAAAFLRKGESSNYDNDDNSQQTTTASTEEVDEYTRMSRLEQFFDGLSNCGRRGTKPAIKVMFDCCEPVPSDNPTEPCKIRALDVVTLGYRMALASTFLQTSTTDTEEEEDQDMARFLPTDDQHSRDALQALAQSVVRHARDGRSRMGLPPMTEQEIAEGLVTESDVFEWNNDVAPLFAATLSTLMFRIFCPGQPYPPSRTEFVYPIIPFESAFFEAGSSPLLFMFGCLSSALGGHFHRLYTSLSDGLSFNRLQNSLLGYGGPTLLIIRSSDGDMFGAFTASPWKESKDFYGNSDCFLFQLMPTMAVYRPSGTERNFMYCNSFARSRGYDKQAHGVGFGGSIHEPRLFIAEAWDACVASSRDLTFDNGALLSANKGKYFTLEALEVWGVGGEEVVAAALGDRVKAREIKDAALRKARKVDKAAFLDDFRSGLISSKAFAHRQEARGRADADLEDRDRETRRRFG